MNNSHTIKINELCRESLLQALLLLMKNQAVDKISITELCKKAGVSRMAFYKNFDSKEAILEDYISQMLDDSVQLISTLDLSNTYNSSLVYFQMIKDNQDFFEIVLLRHRNEYVLNQIFTYLFNSFNASVYNYNLSKDEIKPFAYYRGAGLIYLAVYWIEHSFKESVTEMANLATKFDLH